MKSYHLDLVRVVEAGAIAASAWVGRGDKELADKSATDAMRERLNSMDFAGRVAIGEGKKDNSHGLYEGETIGNLSIEPEYEIAVDPIEGTTPTAKGGYEAMSVIAMAGIDCLYKTDSYYMNKLAVGPKIGKRVKLDINNSPQTNVAMAAAALGRETKHITVCVLDRPRTEPLVEELRKIGCRIRFISDCDVTACISTCIPDSGIDMYWSIGGSPEAVISAAAMKCLGGWMQCVECADDFSDNGKKLLLEDLASGPVMFAGTGITDGKLTKGVRWTNRGPVTHSLAMRSESGTIRFLETTHGN